MTIASTKTVINTPVDAAIGSRIVEEGFGPGAWHGPDLRAAIGDVTAKDALWRPGSGRHNIAEVAVHHAACVRSVIGQLTGSDEPAFPLEGSDWYEISNERKIKWSKIAELVESQHARLGDVVSEIGNGVRRSPLSDAERFDLLLGVTCHAVYHAGQIQLVKALNAK
jgi:hypothetical protein